MIIGLCLVLGCNEDVTGIVVDAETGQPIEGAVVLVEWTETRGIPGMTVTDSYKVVEAVTDKEGKAEISGVLSPFVRGPEVTVYKKGYVAWNNHYIFPGWKKRTDFKWANNYIFKLEIFKPEYGYDDHASFIQSSISSSAASEKKQLMKNSYRWEELKALDERRKKGGY
jgi:hypothetical protein